MTVLGKVVSEMRVKETKSSGRRSSSKRWGLEYITVGLTSGCDCRSLVTMYFGQFLKNLSFADERNDQHTLLG